MSDRPLAGLVLPAPLAQALQARPVTIELERTLERRIQAYAQRLNARLAREHDSDPYDPSSDADLTQLIALLCEIALDADEQGA